MSLNDAAGTRPEMQGYVGCGNRAPAVANIRFGPPLASGTESAS